ncbi:MAG: hypothetical protein LBS20_13855 [Prevotella sp.]|jgi:hypothetical protein|nr:hypothetical protein [Prevotella sp.]
MKTKQKKNRRSLKAVAKAVVLPLAYLLSSEEGLTDYQLFVLMQKSRG